jgi:hypothetical protein
MSAAYRNLGCGLILAFAGACATRSDGKGGSADERVAVASEALTASPDANCTSGSYNGHAYWFCPALRAWQDARNKCQAIGFDLTSVETSGENQFLLGKVSLNAWVGGSDSAAEGTWRWAPPNGSQFWQGKASGSAVGGAYTNWKSGQPDDLLNQDCSMFQGGTGQGKWSDENCGLLLNFVCEGDLCANDPNKTDPGQCGCGVPDTDTDGDGTANCKDQCPTDATKTAAGVCGCGVPDADNDGDGTLDCKDGCPSDAKRVAPGDCGCANAPKPVGTTCGDGLCSVNNQCDGAGTCGNPANCAVPDSHCKLGLFNNTYYWFCDNNRTFDDARQRCQSVGMDLAVIRGTADDNFITPNLNEHSFIGASDRSVEGNFSWIGPGEPFWTGGQHGAAVASAYANWEPGQPFEDLAGAHDCTVKDPPIGQGKWETQLCSFAQPYVCQDLSVSPFVNCVTRFTDTQFVAQFGYRNPNRVAVMVAAGPTNRLNPAVLGVQPPATLQPGQVQRAFWAPFDGTSISWKLGQHSATASAASKRCDAGDYNSPAPGSAQARITDPDRPGTPSLDAASSRLAPNSTDTSGSSSGRPRVLATGSSLPTTCGADTPFLLHFSRLALGGIGGFESADVDAEVSIAGISFGSTHVVSEGCGGFPNPSCVGEVLVDRPGELPPDFTLCVPASLRVVPVHIDIIQRDALSSDEHEVIVDTVVDLERTDTRTFTCQTGREQWQLCFFLDFGLNAAPVLTTPPRLCATWNAGYLDDGDGEDLTGIPVTGQKHKRYPAAFAEYALVLSRSVESNSFTANTCELDVGTCRPNVLDADGCVPQADLDALGLAADALFAPADATHGGFSLDFQVRSTFRKATSHFRTGAVGEAGWSVFAVDPGFRSEELSCTDSNGNPTVCDLLTKSSHRRTETVPERVSMADWTQDGRWLVPPSQIVAGNDQHDDVTRVSAVVSAVLRAPDTAIVPGTYTVHANDACPSEKLLTSSCETPGDFAAFVRSDNNPWKYVVAHELGHLIQDEAMGSLKADYTFCKDPSVTSCSPPDVLNDPPGTPPLCGCDQVEPSDGSPVHCLQSLERSTSAQLEGFAHFVASKVWNTQDESECVFDYYKHFLDVACPPGAECVPFNGLQKISPPLPRSCKQPVRWRNNHCAMPQFATEFDWMGFLWNLNTSGANRLSMGDIYNIYRQTCHDAAGNPADCHDQLGLCSIVPANCANNAVDWAGTRGFDPAALRLVGNNPSDPKLRNLRDLGDVFGVSLSTSP